VTTDDQAGPGSAAEGAAVSVAEDVPAHTGVTAEEGVAAGAPGTPTLLGLPALPAPDYPAEVRARLDPDADEVIARYPQSRSALLPLLHLVQAEEGYVSPSGIRWCAEKLDLTTAEVTAVATFYTMYRRGPAGRYHVGVCTNTLCAVLGGDAILAELQEHLGIGNNETTEDGAISLEHIECNAACDYAPVVMVNWEFFDNQTPESAVRLVDDLRAGREVTPTRGAPLCTFRETARILAGFPDRRVDAVEAGGAGGAPSLAGLRLARGERLPGAPGTRVVSPRHEAAKGAEGAEADGASPGAEPDVPTEAAVEDAPPENASPADAAPEDTVRDDERKAAGEEGAEQ